MEKEIFKKFMEELENQKEAAKNDRDNEEQWPEDWHHFEGYITAIEYIEEWIKKNNKGEFE